MVEQSAKGLVLVVEDEPAIADLVRLYLTRDGFGVHVEHGGEAGLAAARKMRPVACVLDIGLPGIDGTEICRRLRESGDWTPVIFLTARDDEVDRIVGLELGADDYLTKPFSPRELVARIKAVLRRTAGPQEGSRVRQVGAIALDVERRSVRAGDSPVSLTPTEFDLLAHLMSRPGRVYSREELLASVWGYDFDPGANVVDVCVRRLRSKLGFDLLKTVRGEGYQLTA